MSSDLIITDAHAHIFPPKIAQKAVGSIGDFYHIPMSHPGSPEALLQSGAAIGTRKYLVCSTATRPAQVVSINDFIQNCCQQHKELLGFATLHPAFEDIPGEVSRVAGLGLRGVKLHPDFQQFCIDDPAAFPIYDACAAAGRPCCHGGVGGFLGQVTTCLPEDGNCYRCIFGTARGDSPAGGTLGPACGVAGSVMAAEAVKYLTGAGELLARRMLSVDLLGGRVETVAFCKKRKDSTL